jgi:hypothetical protein
MLILHLCGGEKPFQKEVAQILVDKHKQHQKQQQETFTIISLDESFFSFMILFCKKGLDRQREKTNSPINRLS